MKKSALIILADGFEEIEAVTPIDILRRAGIDVMIAGLNNKENFVTGSHGIAIKTDIALESAGSDFDACILPGGTPGSPNLAKSDLVSSFLTIMNREKKLIAAICAAPALVLAPAGILDRKKATCFPGMEDSFNESTVFVEEAVVIDSNVITSRGAGTAIQFALAIIAKLLNKETSDSIKEKIAGFYL
ncbi:MAG: DJ-1 family glyoxalase III [Candidatus Omnitrophota bacterium]